MIAVFLHIVFTGGGKDEKRKDFTANPVCFGFGHGLLCFRSDNRNDYFKVTKVCTKCHKRTSVTRSLAHSYTYGGKIEQYYGADKFHDYFYVYKKCTRYDMCHHKVFYNKVAKNHDYRKIHIKRIRQGKKTLTQTRYKCARCGRIMSKIS